MSITQADARKEGWVCRERKRNTVGVQEEENEEEVTTGLTVAAEMAWRLTGKWAGKVSDGDRDADGDDGDDGDKDDNDSDVIMVMVEIMMTRMMMMMMMVIVEMLMVRMLAPWNVHFHLWIQRV